MIWFTKYRKAWLAAAGVGAVVLKCVADGQVTPAEWTEIAIAVATAVGVVAVRNETEEKAQG